jgi:hypothetical protein
MLPYDLILQGYDLPHWLIIFGRGLTASGRLELPPVGAHDLQLLDRSNLRPKVVHTLATSVLIGLQEQVKVLETLIQIILLHYWLLLFISLIMIHNDD